MNKPLIYDIMNEKLSKLEDAIWLGTNRAKRLLSDWEILGIRCSELKVKEINYGRLSDDNPDKPKLLKEIEELENFIEEELERLESLI